MRWRFQDNSLNGFALAAPQAANTSIAITPVADYRDKLFPDEREELGPMAEKRQFGFSSGRFAAQLARKELNLAAASVGRHDRVPIWPPDCRGSITHTDYVAAAAVTTSARGIGIDLEEYGRVEDKLFRMLFTKAETEKLNKLPDEAATVAFSAKEAGYKAVYPIGQKFIGFKEAEIHLQWDEQTFAIDYIGDHLPNKALNSGHGFWKVHADHVLTVFFID